MVPMNNFDDMQQALLRSVRNTRRRLWITCAVASVAWVLLAAFV